MTDREWKHKVESYRGEKRKTDDENIGHFKIISLPDREWKHKVNHTHTEVN